MHAYRPPVKSAELKIIMFISQQKICCGYSKEPSQGYSSFDNPKKYVLTD